MKYTPRHAGHLLLSLSTSKEGEGDITVIFDIGGRLFEALKDSGKDHMNFAEFKTVVLKWFVDHGMPLRKESEEGI